MSELSESIPAEAREESLLSRALAVPVRLDWEKAAYLGLVVVAAIWRFWDLGSRALHHDESLHAWTSWKLFDGQGYEHNPMMHGPFQFFGTALTFFVTGGPSDYTARVWPAIFGTLLVVLPYFLRHRLGRAGALFTAALIAFSPTLLYFSRFARDDIYIAVFTLGLVIALWRYVDEGKLRYLYLGAFLLALAFATMENTFLNVATLLVFLNLWLAFQFWRQIRDENRMDPFSAANLLIFLIPTAWAFVALWPFIGGLRERLGLRERHRAGDFLLILGTFAGPQFAAAVQVPLEALFGIDDQDLGRVVWSHLQFGPYEAFNVTRGDILGFITVTTLISATAVIGLRWNAQAWLLAAAAFYIPYALLYTSFLTNIGGFGSGSWQALDYWLAQHDVRRGDQPDHYYLVLLPA